MVGFGIGGAELLGPVTKVLVILYEHKWQCSAYIRI